MDNHAAVLTTSALCSPGVPRRMGTAGTERSHRVCRGAENIASPDLGEFGLSHKQESWRSRWRLPACDVSSPGEVNTPDLEVYPRQNGPVDSAIIIIH